MTTNVLLKNGLPENVASYFSDEGTVGRILGMMVWTRWEVELLCCGFDPNQDDYCDEQETREFQEQIDRSGISQVIDRAIVSGMLKPKRHEKTFGNVTQVEEYFDIDEVVKWAGPVFSRFPFELKSVADDNSPKTKTSTYLNIIGALLEVIRGECPAVGAHPDVENQAKLIERISEKYSGAGGVSKRTLETVFADANRVLKASLH